MLFRSAPNGTDIGTITLDGQLETRQRRTQRWTLGGRTMDTTMDTRWTLQKHEETYAPLRHLFGSAITCSRPRTKCCVFTVSIVCPSLCPSCVRRVSTKCPACAHNLHLPVQMARRRVGHGGHELPSHTKQTPRRLLPRQSTRANTNREMKAPSVRPRTLKSNVACACKRELACQLKSSCREAFEHSWHAPQTYILRLLEA